MRDQTQRSIPTASASGEARRLTYEQLRWVLQRATSLTPEEERLYSNLDALALGRELGIEDRLIHLALRELDSPKTSARSGRVAAEAVLSQPEPFVAQRLDEALRRRLMDRCPTHGPDCWTQRRDWWPDLQRLGSEIHVVAEVQALASGSSHVSINADLRPKAASYAGWASGGSALVWLTLGPASLIQAAVAWAGIGVAAVAAYRRRAHAIAGRFEELIIEIA